MNPRALKRIVSDVSDIMRHPLEDNGVYYHHNDCLIYTSDAADE